MGKIKKTALIGVVGASALTTGYYTFVKPSTQSLTKNSTSQNINQDIKKENNTTKSSSTNNSTSPKEAVTYSQC